MKPSTLLAIAAGMTLTMAPAHAGVVWSNATAASLGGDLITVKTLAEQFTLSSTTQLTNVEFWQSELQGYPVVTASYDWNIYTSSAGLPDTMVYSGTTSAYTRSYTRSFSNALGASFDEFDINFGINPNLIGAGTYWLSIHVNTPDTSLVFWDGARYCIGGTCSGGSPAGAMIDYPPAGSWANGNVDYAMQLYSNPAPEPATAALFTGAGLILLGWKRRRA